MADDDLTKAEREMIREHREAEAEKRARLADQDSVEISFGDRKFSGPYRRALEVAKAWGFDLEPPAAGSEPDDKGDKTVRFGRRTG